MTDIYTMFLDRATCSSFIRMFQNNKVLFSLQGLHRIQKFLEPTVLCARNLTGQADQNVLLQVCAALLQSFPPPPAPSFKYYAATDTISGKVRSAAAAAIHITQRREWDSMQSWASLRI